MSDVTKEALQYVVGLAPANVSLIGDRTYSDKPIHLITDPTITDIDVTTLGGLVDLINAGFEGFAPADSLLHVANFDQVRLLEKTSDKFGRRKAFVDAKLQDVKGFQFGQYLDHESFVIGLQANFTSAGDREYLLRLASNLTNEIVTTSTDDGVSQQVGLKAGAVLKTTEVIRSRVSLAPFRTFREIEQPASDFIFRVKQQGQSVPNLALFEADGGKWKIDAMENIGRYLRTSTKDIAVIV